MQSKILFVAIKWSNFAIIIVKEEEWILGEAYVTRIVTIYDGLCFGAVGNL
jgi:hypothetical protein